MRDRDDGARILIQESLQPRDRLRVEMVGGLIEQQHVRLRQQQAAERDPAAFAAGQLRYVGFPRRQSQGIRRDLEFAIEFPGTRRIDSILEFALFLEQRIHLLVRHRFGEGHAELVEAVDQRLGLPDAVFDITAHVFRRVEFRLLRQVTDLDARLRSRFTVDLGVDAGHDSQQCRLARSIEAEHTDLGAGEKRQGDVVDDLTFRRDHLGHAIHRVNVLRHLRRLMLKERALSGMLRG